MDFPFQVFFKIVSRDKKREAKVYQQWTLTFLQILKTQSVLPPTYLNDFHRTMLLFRKYDENKQNLSAKQSQVRYETSLLHWLKILKVEMKDELIDENPRDFMDTHSWAAELVYKNNITSNKTKMQLQQLIERAKSGKKGLFVCSSCSSDDCVVTKVIQNRRSDEGGTVVNECSRCQKKWRLRS